MTASRFLQRRVHPLLLLLACGLFATTATAAESAWTRSSALPGTHAASATERAELQALLAGTMIRDYIDDDDGTLLVHDGDLRIDGHLDHDTVLAVRGNVEVTGMFDDYRSDIGVLIVLGDLRVADAYSWGALHVRGDLHARGLVMAIYNDFIFEVTGEVHARGLVVSDKSADYRRGDLGFVLDDMGEATPQDIVAGLRQLLPALYTAPGHLDLYSGALDELQPDHEAARTRLAAGEAVFRDTPASEALPKWVAAAIAERSDGTTLDALAGRDPLVDQLIASRGDLDAALARKLAAGGDPVVRAWLAQTAPDALDTD